ncbi:unnamed protein product [Parnassius apollo]|uniref:(apollo) hypothetical protein n=1 Tax=Parnassius apollo TaxID=110799 RepID=A0A8S3WFN8_PARAO|nr:unnamed protein product [Parnassius apollo]
MRKILNIRISDTELQRTKISGKKGGAIVDTIRLRPTEHTECIYVNDMMLKALLTTEMMMEINIITKRVCQVSTGSLENSPGGYYVDGVKAECANYVCQTDTGLIFIHSSPLEQLEDRDQSYHIADHALCTNKFCIDPSSMFLYKAKQTVKSPAGWDATFVCTTGETLTIQVLRQAESRSGLVKRDTSTAVRKIMYLEEETARLSLETKTL